MKSVIHLRISDNVLDPPQWPVVEATIVDGRIIELKEINPGVYGWPAAVSIGSTIDHLQHWLKYDGTPTHPVADHDIKLPDEEKWRNIFKMDVFKQLLEEASV